MLIGIIWTYVVVIKGIVKRCLNPESKRNLSFDLFDETETIRKLERNLLNSDLFKAKNILIAFEAKGTDMGQNRMEKKGSESSTPKKIGAEKEMKEWLRRQNLPGSTPARDMIIDEAEFLLYQRIWMKKEYGEEMKEKGKIYDGI